MREISDLRSELKIENAELRALIANCVTRDELHEALRLHVDARIGAVSRSWMVSTMAMQAATIAGVIAAAVPLSRRGCAPCGRARS